MSGKFLWTSSECLRYNSRTTLDRKVVRLKKGIWIFISIVLLAALVFSIFVWNRPAPAVRTEPEIIYELVRGYERTPVGSEKENAKLLQELEAVNPETAARWNSIMECWATSNGDMPINPNALPDGLADSDTLCIIVLGYQLNPDGTMKEELIGRLETAKASAEKYPDAYILCTGGGTAAASTVTEAEAMAAWLSENGIDKSKILVESRSLTTTENAIYCARLLHEAHPEVTQAALISSDYHLPWASILFQTQFILAGQDVQLVSNAAYVTSTTLRGSSLLRYQANGILEIYSHF